MQNQSISKQIEALSVDPAQRENAERLLSALGKHVPDHIEQNLYNRAICFDWRVDGEWDDVEVEVHADRFETYLSRDGEVRINHFDPNDLKKVLDEVLRK